MRLFCRSVAVVGGLFRFGTVLVGQEAELPTVVVEGKAESLIGIAPSASKG